MRRVECVVIGHADGVDARREARLIGDTRDGVAVDEYARCVAAQRFTAERKGPSILTNSQKLNRESTFFRAERSAEKIYGTAMSLSVVASGCKTTTWNFNEPDFGVLAQEAGCLNCG